MTAKQIKQPVMNIIHSIDGEEVFKQCGLGLSKCNDAKPCPIHNDYKPVREMFKKMCTDKRVCDLYENVNKGLAYLIG